MRVASYVLRVKTRNDSTKPFDSELMAELLVEVSEPATRNCLYNITTTLVSISTYYHGLLLFQDQNLDLAGDHNRGGVRIQKMLDTG